MTFDKQLYRERREKGLRGQTAAVTVHQPASNAGEEPIPLGNKTGSTFSFGKGRRGSNKPPSDPKYTKKQSKR